MRGDRRSQQQQWLWKEEEEEKEEAASVAAAEDALARGRAGCAVCGLTCTPWPRDARARTRASGCVRASGSILTVIIPISTWSGTCGSCNQAEVKPFKSSKPDCWAWGVERGCGEIPFF